MTLSLNSKSRDRSNRGFFKRSMVLLACSLLFASCDPRVEYFAALENESTSDIQVVVQTTFDSVPDTIIVGTGERTVLTYLDQIGTVDEFEGCPLNWAQQIQFSVVDDEEAEVLINPNNSNNWVYTVDTKNIIGAGQCSCKLDLLEIHVE